MEIVKLRQKIDHVRTTSDKNISVFLYDALVRGIDINQTYHKDEISLDELASTCVD